MRREVEEGKKLLNSGYSLKVVPLASAGGLIGCEMSEEEKNQG